MQKEAKELETNPASQDTKKLAEVALASERRESSPGGAGKT